MTVGKNMPDDKKKKKSLLEAILEDFDEKARKEVDEHIKDTSPESQVEMLEYKYGGLKVGTREFFNGIYNSTKKYIQEKKLQGKQDDSSITEILEKYVLDSLESLGPAEKRAALLYKERKARGDFPNASALRDSIKELAGQHLGVRERAFDQIYETLKSGDVGEFYQGLRRLNDMASEGVVQTKINKKHTALVAKHGKEGINAYLIDQMRNNLKYKVKEEQIPDKLQLDPFALLNTYHKADSHKKKKELQAMDLEEVKEEKTPAYK